MIRRRRPLRAAGLVLLALGLGAGSARAERPLATEDAGVAGKGVFQEELSVEYAGRGGTERDATVLFVPIYGLSERIELSAEIPYKQSVGPDGGRQRGPADITVVAKGLLLPENPAHPAVLLRAQVKLATGDPAAGLGSGDEDLGFIAVVSRAWGAAVADLNLGYVLVGRKVDPALRDYAVYSLGGTYALTGSVKLVAEVYGETDHHFDIGAFAHHLVTPLAGVLWQAGAHVVLDAALLLGLDGSTGTEYGSTLGVSLSF